MNTTFKNKLNVIVPFSGFDEHGEHVRRLQEAATQFAGQAGDDYGDEETLSEVLSAALLATGHFSRKWPSSDHSRAWRHIAKQNYVHLYTDCLSAHLAEALAKEGHEATQPVYTGCELKNHGEGFNNFLADHVHAWMEGADISYLYEHVSSEDLASAAQRECEAHEQFAEWYGPKPERWGSSCHSWMPQQIGCLIDAYLHSLGEESMQRFSERLSAAVREQAPAWFAEIFERRDALAAESEQNANATAPAPG